MYIIDKESKQTIVFNDPSEYILKYADLKAILKPKAHECSSFRKSESALASFNSIRRNAKIALQSKKSYKKLKQHGYERAPYPKYLLY
jgi:hypothetical protein